jgi:nucleotide-binding universal stress UspA family protein
MMVWNVKKILVPTDGSKAARLAVIPALDTAKQRNAEVVALFVVAMPHLLADRATEAVRRDVGEPAVKEVVRAAEKENLKVKSLVEEGNPVDTILKVAKRENIDLIVMGTRGASITKRLLGSVASSVITYAPCPVLAVREKVKT